MDLFTKYATRNQQFCLVLDEMDHLFADSELLTDFLLVLRKWKMSTKHFRGFLNLYSARSWSIPVVFASLIRCTVDYGRWGYDETAWEAWFREQQFAEYMSEYNRPYKRLQDDLLKLSDEDRGVLKYALERIDGLTAGSEHGAQLLSMGVLVDSGDGRLVIASPMMHRLCTEALTSARISRY